MPTYVMTRQAPRRKLFQAGSFLLEALIAILIVALGVLGSVGLLARSMQDLDDAKYRGEAAYLANQYLSQMWLSDRLTVNLLANYSSTPGTGVPYTDFVTLLTQRLPNGGDFPPDVDVVPGPIVPPIPAQQTNSLVTITIWWKPPGIRGTAQTDYHQYIVTASIGANR
jgi:type IV pilus assembly protein PilV